MAYASNLCSDFYSGAPKCQTGGGLDFGRIEILLKPVWSNEHLNNGPRPFSRSLPWTEFLMPWFSQFNHERVHLFFEIVVENCTHVCMQCSNIWPLLKPFYKSNSVFSLGFSSSCESRLIFMGKIARTTVKNFGRKENQFHFLPSPFFCLSEISECLMTFRENLGRINHRGGRDKACRTPKSPKKHPKKNTSLL